MSKHKYGAKPTTVNGIRFASKAEARRYSELLLLARAGEIIDLGLQPTFSLRVPLKGGGFKEIGKYKGDFSYVIPGYRPILDKAVVEDVKGFKTPMYRWKKKHVEAQYGITITEITK